MRRAIARGLRILLAAALPVSLEAVAVNLRHVNNTTIALVLVMVVFSVALVGDWLEALMAAVAAGLGLDYFVLPPAGFGIHGTEQIVAFLTFLLTAIATSQLAARAKRSRDEAVRRQAELEQLNRLSDVISAYENADLISQRVADALIRTLAPKTAAVYDKIAGQIYRSGPRSGLIADDQLRAVAANGDGFEDPKALVWIMPLRRDGQIVGSIGLEGASASQALLDAVADKIGLALARAHSAARAKEAEVARKSQEFKAAVMDALAHEARNVLHSIKIAATNLLSEYPGSAAQQREMLTLINQETDHMNGWLAEAVSLNRGHAGELAVNKTLSDVRSIVLTSLEISRPLLEGRPVTVETPDFLPPVECDAGMIRRALQLLLDNAVKYSPPGSPIRLSSDSMDGLVVVKVADSGPGVADSEQDRIFEKYYRGCREQERSAVPGMGLGLASAKYFVESHGGEIWVTNAPEGGAVFQFSLPASKQEVACDELENSYRGR